MRLVKKPLLNILNEHLIKHFSGIKLNSVPIVVPSVVADGSWISFYFCAIIILLFVSYKSPSSRKAIMFPMVGLGIFFVDAFLGKPFFFSLAKLFIWAFLHYIFELKYKFLRDQLPYKLVSDIALYRQTNSWMKDIPPTKYIILAYIIATVSWNLCHHHNFFYFLMIGAWGYLLMAVCLSVVNVLLTPLVPDRIWQKHGVPIRFMPMAKKLEFALQLCKATLMTLGAGLAATESAMDANGTNPIAGPIVTIAANHVEGNSLLTIRTKEYVRKALTAWAESKS